MPKLQENLLNVEETDVEPSIVEQGVDVGEDLPSSMAEINNSEDEMRAELESKLENIKNKNRVINTKKFIDKNKLKETKLELLQTFFRILQELGVDPNNLESINSFMQKLEQQDPDLVALFELAFSALVPNEPSESSTGLPTGQSDQGIEPISPETVPTEPALTDKFSNLQEQVLRQ